MRPRDGAAPALGAVLESGEDALRARIESLERAKSSVRIQALIFRGDEVGLHISEILKKKKAEGLRVRVIVDAASNLDWPTQWMYFDLKQHGIEVEGYEALYLEPITAEIEPRDPLRPNKRFHDKLWIVDGEDPKEGFAIVGGLNIANEYYRLGLDPLSRWRDQDVALRGSIVEDVRVAFDRNYDFFKGIKASRPELLNPDNAWRLARKTLGKISTLKVPNWTKKEITNKIASVLEVKLEPRLAFHPIRARFIQSRPRFEEHYIRQAYRALIDGAEREILIANAYVIPPRELISALTRAARRGIRVTVITNSPETNDIRQVAIVSRFTYADLLGNDEAAPTGVEIREWEGLRFDEGTLHAKFALFDGKTALVGSYNLDPRSERLNSETVLALDDTRVVAELERLYRNVYVKQSRAISIDEALGFRKAEDLVASFEMLFSLQIKDWL